MNAVPDLADIVARAIPRAADRVPATPDELRDMQAAADMPAALVALYQLTGELYLDGFTLFEPALFVDVNHDREDFGELAELTYFGADQASGFFAVDPFDRIGLGTAAIYWVDRGWMEADAVVPAGDTLTGFLHDVGEGRRPWQGDSLGVRAESRLLDRLDHLPPTVEPGPPLDPMVFVAARAEGKIVPVALAAMLERSNGLWLGPDRRIFRFEEMERLPAANAVIIGEDKALGRIAVTMGGWQDLPADRMFAFAPGSPPESGKLLGRTADVIGYWIEEAA